MEKMKVIASLELILVMATTGCSSLEVATDPRSALSPQQLRTLEAITKGPRVKVAMPESVRDIGCSAVATVDGQTSVAILPRPLVIDLVGKLDSAYAPIIRGRPGAGTLHVVSGFVPNGSSGRTFTVHCLAPMALNESVFMEKLRLASSFVATIVTGRLQRYPNSEKQSDPLLASQLLLSPIRSTFPQKLVRLTAGANSDVEQASLIPRFDLICGPGTDYACGTPTLPTVTVSATPGYPVVVDISMIYHDYRVYSLSDLYGVYFYGGPDCGNASEAWIALNEEIIAMEDRASEMEAATNAVSNLTCQGELTDNGHNICLDLFIMGEQASFLIGDDRTFDPSAPYKASRAQIYINPGTCTVTWVVNTTRNLSWGPFGAGTHAPHKLNKVQAHLNDTAQCVVEWELLNGWCQSHSTLTLDGYACPAIDGRITFTNNGQSGWTANINEDLFPSRGLYKWNGSSWVTISERRETIWWDLVSWRKKIEDLKIVRDQETMPPGCMLQ